ncbi:GNAT family N-acetyltransferase [Pseudomonas asturiensis]|uniref:GNAT family N-acetyltransferase n=2 Tax=Pseudomonas asturiensis TaxID=1190415 RepID=A0ABX6HJB6_9PSED|nr:GNAT family N-acetyltransferase [Pseudomonas asturiensis]
MQVFLDTYATEGIRDSIAQEVLDSFSPANLSELLAKSDTFIIVAEIDDHLVGFAQVAMNTGHNLIAHPNSSELQRLYVQERFTGRGVGYRLLEEAEKYAHLGGASLLWATVWAGNSRALSFYPRQGYEHLGSPAYTFQNETHENRLFGKALGQGTDIFLAN